MRSPIGEGARRGLPAPSLMVAERRGFWMSGGLCGWVGFTAEFGGGLGGPLEAESIWGFVNAELLRESRLNSPVPRSCKASGM